MKNLKNNFFYTLVLSLCFLFSCCKEAVEDFIEDQLNNEVGFYYGENGTSSLTKADDAQVNKAFNSIIAKKNSQTVVEINLNDVKTGTYSLSAKYAFTYVKDGKHWEATAGTLTISKNDGSKISGTYEATAGSGVTGVTSVKGKFTDVPLK